VYCLAIAPGGRELTSEFCLKHISGDASAVYDLVFIHGLTGEPVATWSFNGTDSEKCYWPKWFGIDRHDFRVFVLGYPASAFVPWAKLEKTELTLFELAKTALEFLVSEQIGKRPLAFICHSLGGLLAKQMLRTAGDASDDGWRAIADNTRLVAFIATPHVGASLASILQKFAFGFSSANVVTLTNNSGHLNELNEAYREAASKCGVRTLAYYEKKPYGGTIWVNENSANPGISGTSPMPLEADHLTVCKPENRGR
jgi:pimeloyl-ACP methyl ester carboxylesterase